MKTLLLFVAGILLLVAFGWWTRDGAPLELGGSRRLSGSECKARKLSRLDDCVGIDDSWQECRYYFRASGVPDRAWCEGLRSREGAPSSSLARCDFSSVRPWTNVRCEEYGFAPNLFCFGCNESRAEANKTFIYAYDAACARGIEQVTCNFDPKAVGKAIASLR